MTADQAEQKAIEALVGLLDSDEESIVLAAAQTLVGNATAVQAARIHAKETVAA